MALRKRFSDKTFFFDSQFRRKGEAGRKAMKIRSAGGLARVTFDRGDGIWIVWSKGK